MLKGIAASAGYAVGKIYKLNRPELVIEKRTADAETELAKLAQAITLTHDDITLIKERATGKLSDEDLAIFDAHLMVLSDPEYTGQIENKIKQDQINADYAIKEVADTFISIFENMDDDYFKERAADIKDVTFRLTAHVLGVTIPDLSLIKEAVIIVAEDLTPSDTAQLNRQYTLGFATEIGGRTSHSAIMARSLEIPAVVGCQGLLKVASHGAEMILDAVSGTIILNPSVADKTEYQKRAKEFADYRESLKALKELASVTADGVTVEIAANIGTPNDVTGVIDNGADGIGLYRTEFLYMDKSNLPSEEEQFQAYKSVLASVNPKPVVVRTLDIGGDKKLPYLPLPEEMNPFLGYRAIRLCLDRTDIFITQLRALIRASAFGNLRIMFPMIATVDEFRQAKAIYTQEKERLIAEGVKVADNIEVGMMVEIPAAAVLADQFAKEADFFSIGTNDLIQYSMAADRMSEKVSYLYQPLSPSILRLIKLTIDGAHKENKWCGMCGEMAGDPQAVPLLLGLGLDEFSMSASSVLETRQLIRSLKQAEMRTLAEQALNCSTSTEVEELVTKL